MTSGTPASSCALQWPSTEVTYRCAARSEEYANERNVSKVLVEIKNATTVGMSKTSTVAIMSQVSGLIEELDRCRVIPRSEIRIVDLILVWTLDRLVRSTRDLLETISTILECRSKFKSISEHWAAELSDPPEGCVG